jgi:ABC-type glycerol-3-phosphate transport system substrate-binding protein
MRSQIVLAKTLVLATIIGVVFGSNPLPPTQAQGEIPLPAIRVWWPDKLYPPQAQAFINNTFSEFGENNQLELRYFEHLPGNDIHRLELTRNVAPGALPDVMIMRREDLVMAVGEGLLRPIEGWVLPGILDGLSPNLLDIGRVNDTLYGLPYMLEIEFVVYNSADYDVPPTNFDQIVAHDGQVLFPARPQTGQAVNNFVMLQYIAAGGEFIDAEGSPILTENALRVVLRFYADALEGRILNTSLLSYTAPADYWQRLENNEAALALVDSTSYIKEGNGLPEGFQSSTVPTPNGTRYVLLNGWLWVLLTNDPARQAQAQRLLNWMMDTDKLADTAIAVQMIPGQQRALRVLDNPAAANIRELLPNAVFIGEERNNAAGVALQTAFEAVLSGVSPDSAAAAALNSLQTP